MKFRGFFSALSVFACAALLSTMAASAKPVGDVVRILPHLAKSSGGNRPLQPYGFYKREALWVQRPINVCWNMSLADYNSTRPYRHQITAQIANTWSRVSTAKFVGWRKCGSSISNGFGIAKTSGTPHTDALGEELNGNLSGMSLNFDYQSWSPSCQSSLSYCDTVIATHEFGHALGLSHEQNRPDTDRKVCTQDPQGENGDVVVGAWDLASVMNYCNPNWDGNGSLSATDIATIQQMYGDPLMPSASPFDLIFPHVAVGDCELDGATLTINPDGSGVWNAQVKTNHTHHYDVWHASVQLLDPVQNDINNIPNFDGPHMHDDHGYYPWQQSFSFPAVLFGEIKGARLHSSC